MDFEFEIIDGRSISITNITFPDSVMSIGGEAFFGCDSLVNITLPDSIKNIGDSAFSFCMSLKNITIPDSIINIEDFENINLCDETVIGKNAFPDTTKIIYREKIINRFNYIEKGLC